MSIGYEVRCIACRNMFDSPVPGPGRCDRCRQTYKQGLAEAFGIGGATGSMNTAGSAKLDAPDEKPQTRRCNTCRELFTPAKDWLYASCERCCTASRMEGPRIVRCIGCGAEFTPTDPLHASCENCRAQRKAATPARLTSRQELIREAMKLPDAIHMRVDSGDFAWVMDEMRWHRRVLWSCDHLENSVSINVRPARCEECGERLGDVMAEDADGRYVCVPCAKRAGEERRTPTPRDVIGPPKCCWCGVNINTENILDAGTVDGNPIHIDCIAPYMLARERTGEEHRQLNHADKFVIAVIAVIVIVFVAALICSIWENH